MAAPSIASGRGPYATQSAVLQPFQPNGEAYSSGVLAESHPIPLPSLHSVAGSFTCLFPPGDTVDSELVVGMKPCHFGVVIGYQIDEFTCTWSAQHFVA